MFSGNLKLQLWTIAGIYLLVINLIGLIMMGVDKDKARRQAWRVPEATLFFVAAIGGCVVAIIGMYAFRHKTKHLLFIIGLPLILLIQIGLLLWFLFASPFELMVL